MVSDVVSSWRKIQQDHMGGSDAMECGSCWKDLEATSVCLRDGRALEIEDSRGACGLNLVSCLGSPFL